MTPQPEPEPKLTEDYTRNIFAFAFLLGATFSFVAFYYCNVLFFALQQQKQVGKNIAVERVLSFKTQILECNLTRTFASQDSCQNN
jgi:hypothetical protein